jgi:hypothetical protein
VIGGRAGEAVDPDAARRAANAILDDRRYRRDPAPRPLRSQLGWLGDRLSGIGDFLERIFGRVPGLVWLALAAVALVLGVAYFTRNAHGRRLAATIAGRSRRAAAPRGDPDALERAADEAERNGDLERALRLRFRAGLLRLGARGTIRYRPSVTTGEVRRALGSETFDELARALEEIVYGRRPAERPDVDAARREWPRVLDEVGKR